MIIDDAVDEAGLAWFEALAERVTDALVRCGYPRCAGDVMATNPRWRRPLAQWRREFSSWLPRRRPRRCCTPRSSSTCARSTATIAPHPAQQHVLRASPGAAHLPRPPRQAGRGRTSPRSGSSAGSSSRRPASTGTPSTSSAAGILPSSSSPGSTRWPSGRRPSTPGPGSRRPGRAGSISDELADDLRDAFEFIGYVRLRHQAAQVRAGVPTDNFVAPGRPVELREAAPARGLRHRALGAADAGAART